MSTMQLGFEGLIPSLPDGFGYRADLLSALQEARLIGHLRELHFKEFEFHGYRGKRRVVSFGLHCDFDHGTLREAAEIPDFLLPLRETAAASARLAAAEFEHVLVAQYPPGAGIGWHRDRAVFQEVVGVSLGSPCRFRLRRKRGSGWERASVIVEPRSVYLLRGPARTEWEHSIPPAERLRYSVTFRSLKAKLGLPTKEHSR